MPSVMLLRIVRTTIGMRIVNKTGTYGRGTQLVLTVVLLGVLLISGCSRVTMFVVINKSDSPIEVRYKIRESPSDFLLVCGPPAILKESQLNTEQPWQELSASQYQSDPGSRVITVSLKPNEALRITVAGNVEDERTDAWEAEHFCVDEISLVGNYGEMRFKSRQAYKSFLGDSSGLRSLIYH